eukprot:Lithocolla_globosa_v1_NODE_527_length_3806_cov_53.570515.p4 type:complete len:113 gc:universal NODE_527_length_3806_cov_53.570515:222-560(+)
MFFHMLCPFWTVRSKQSAILETKNEKCDWLAHNGEPECCLFFFFMRHIHNDKVLCKVNCFSCNYTDWMYMLFHSCIHNWSKKDTHLMLSPVSSRQERIVDLKAPNPNPLAME